MKFNGRRKVCTHPWKGRNVFYLLAELVCIRQTGFWTSPVQRCFWHDGGTINCLSVSAD